MGRTVPTSLIVTGTKKGKAEEAPSWHAAISLAVAFLSNAHLARGSDVPASVSINPAGAATSTFICQEWLKKLYGKNMQTSSIFKYGSSVK